MTDEVIHKSESNPKTVTRPLSSEIGNNGIVTSSRFISDLRKDDLCTFDRRVVTYSNMMYDDAVSRSVGVTNEQVLAALYGGEVKPQKSNISKAASDFLNYTIRNMLHGSWLESSNNACTDLINGVALQNIVVQKARYGPYKGSKVLKTLMPYSPKSIYGWVWDKENRYLKGFVQKPMVIKQREPNLKRYQESIPYDLVSSGGYYQSSKYPFVATEQMLHFRHNPKYGNPEGDSPLNHCYDAWVEKRLVEHFQIVGVSKDFG